jgi:hypothetical protein
MSIADRSRCRGGADEDLVRAVEAGVPFEHGRCSRISPRSPATVTAAHPPTSPRQTDAEQMSAVTTAR